MDMNEAQSKALERGLNDATALSQDEWRGVALAMMAQCQPWYEELERLRAAAEGLEAKLAECRDLAQQRVDKLFREEGTEWIAHEDEGRRQGYNGAMILGRELGLWK